MSKPVFQDIFRFSGRRNRKSYILFLLAQFACLVTIAILVAIAAAGGNETILTIVTFLCFVAGIPVGIAGWAVSSQRCRDFGWTGWATLITLVPYIGWIFPVAIIFVPGTQGANRYGPDPLDAAMSRPVRLEPPLGSAAVPG
jgi:uncharacterized membrane protein YhaH (DUF805 family)